MSSCSLQPAYEPASREKISAKPVSVCLLISSLEFGGAERQVVEMMRTFDRSRIRPVVCSLSGKVPLADALPDRQNCLHIIEKRSRFDFTTIFRVAGFLRRQKFDVVHAFHFDSEIVARLAAPIAGVPVVIASERNTDYTRRFKHKLALKLTKPLFDVMVANSNAGKQFNIRTQGLAPDRIEVVHNGVDTDRFFPDRAAGDAFRNSLGIPRGTPVIGMVGSYKRQKAHDIFVNMAALVHRSLPAARFLIVGGPLTADGEAGRQYEQSIHRMADALGLSGHCHFIGNQKDMNAVYNACDVTALVSRHEGTPNVVLESMACGIPVVATNVSDNAIIIDNARTGFVVPVNDPAAAADCAVSLLGDSSRLIAMGEAARVEICAEFSLLRAAGKLETIYSRCLNKKQRN